MSLFEMPPQIYSRRSWHVPKVTRLSYSRGGQATRLPNSPAGDQDPGQPQST